MNLEDFQQIKLVRLEKLTGISSPRWSKYIRGIISFRETTLLKAAVQLKMTPVELLEAIHQRRNRASAE
jgi:hypothetical protein